MKTNPSTVIQPTDIKNRYWPFETEENPSDNGNSRTDSLNEKVTVKQNAINKATENIQNSNDKAESDTPDKKKLPVTIILGDSMVKDIIRWKMSRRTRKVVVKHFSGAKTIEIKNLVSFQQLIKNLIISSYIQEQRI